MRIETEKVRAGLLDGETVYVCHYLHPEISNKPLRNLPPTKVLVRCNDEISKNIYYSESHFVAFNKNGTLSKKVFSPVDNTGYRSRHGNEVHVFDNYGECAESWNTQIEACLPQFDEEIRLIEQRRTALKSVMIPVLKVKD